MKKGMIGVQMSMLKDKVVELGVYETMKKMAEVGYRCVEISQVDMNADNVAQFKKASQDFGIKVAAMSAAVEPMMPGMPGENLTADFDKIVADCKALDCNFLRIGALPFNLLGEKAKIMEFVGKAEAFAHRLAEHGIELYYHNHHFEFAKSEGKLLQDIIRENTTKLGFELDVHWIQRGGKNPVDYIKEYNGRVRLLHLKDFRIATPDFSKVDGKDRTALINALFNIIEFGEVGEGNLDMKGIIETGLACGSEYFLVEQDDTYGRDPFDSLKISADNLKAMGYAGWF